MVQRMRAVVRSCLWSKVPLPVWLFIWTAAAGIPISHAESPSAMGMEYKVKAAFLFSLAKFVDWPPEKLASGGPIVVCVYGKDPFEGSLAHALDGKTVDGKA